MESGNIIVDALSTAYRDSRSKLNNLVSSRSFCKSELNTDLKYRDYIELENTIENYNTEIEALEKYIEGIHDAREIVMKITMNNK